MTSPTYIYDPALQAKLEAEGLHVKVWRDRLYLRQGSRDLGYITDADLSGGTGTCKQVKRSGAIAKILRDLDQ